MDGRAEVPLLGPTSVKSFEKNFFIVVGDGGATNHGSAKQASICAEPWLVTAARPITVKKKISENEKNDRGWTGGGPLAATNLR